MFASFKETFIRKPQFTGNIPQAVLKTIGRDLPEGFRYTEEDDGICRLDCDEQMTFNFTFKNIEIPEEAKEIFKQRENCTIEKILQYSYNAQKCIKLIPDEEGCYTINNEKIKAEKIAVTPMKGITIKERAFYLMPAKFPEPFSIEVSGNGFTLNLMLQRQPVNSITEVKMATVEKRALDVSYIFDRSEIKRMKINISTNQIGSASDILAAKEIFNAFISGTGTLDGIKVKGAPTHQNKKIDNGVLKFWHQIVEVEEALNIKFNVDQKITVEDIKKIQEFHRCFVEETPFKVLLKENTVRGIAKINKDDIKTKSYLVFEYAETLQEEILGVPLQYCKLFTLFNGKISEMQLPEKGISGEFWIKFVPEEGKQMYSVTQYYMEQEQCDSARIDPAHFEKFLAAEELERYE